MVSTPITSINLPTEEFINETFDFSVKFDNTGNSEGYGPFFDLVVPKGITLGTASYLGAAVSVVTYTRTATGWVDGSGAAVTVHPYGTGIALPTGATGDKWNLIQLPFGSFVADQPVAEIDFLGNILSKANGAQVATGLNLSSRGGFRYGNDAFDNAAGDPPVQQGATTTKTITPKVIELTKDSDAPEEETATGENFARTYTLTINIANGEKIDNLEVRDFLPNNLVYVPGTLSISGATATSIEQPTPGAAQNAPNNDFVLNLGSVTGTTSESDVVITYKAYAPKLDANNASVIDPASGDDRIALNESQVTGTYGGVAVSDGTTDTVGLEDDPADYTLDLKSIAIQKGVAVVGGGIAKPGAVLEYTLNFQISDYFSFQDININDIFSDGQRFDSSFAPTLIINGNNGTTGSTSFGSFSGDVNGTFTSNNLTGSVATGTNGSTTLNFNVSGQLINSAVDADGILVGDLVDNFKQSGTTATLVYRTVIQDNFSNQQNLPGYTGDASVDLADVLTNNVTINGKVVGSNQIEEDTSAASIAIPEPTASKEIYAINGVVVTDPAQAKIAPGQTVTYRLKMNLPIADTEKLKLTDYLPLPVFEATQLTGSIGNFAGIPATGSITFGPNHTLNSIIPSVTPTFTTNATQNTIAINFGSFDDPQNRAATIDLLFTVTASDKPFTDALLLTNQAAVEYGSTDDAFKAAVTEIVQVELLQPTLKLTKGVVSTNATSPTFDQTVGPVTFAAPGTVGAAFTGTINSAGLKTTPVDTNLTGVDAGDLVRFAVVVENTGGSGAFDAAIKDILPAGLSNPQNLRVTDGAGNVLTYTGDLFGSNGLTLTDDADGALDKGRTGNTATTNGKNIIVITYDATVDSSIQPKQTLTSGAEILQFAGKEGGTDHTANATNTNWVNTASSTAATPKVTLNLVGTEVTNATNSNTQAVIGELVEYELVLTVPEGVTPSSTLVNTLPTGLSLADFTGLTVSSGLTSSTVTDVNSLLTNTSTSGKSFTVNFGTLTNSNSSNAASETLTLRFRAVVSNVVGNQNNTALNHVASNVNFNWNNGTAQSVTATEADNVSNKVTVVEPDVSIVKDVVVNGSGNLGDAGDSYEYTITISHGATNPDAYDITFKDVLNSKLATGATLTSVTDSANILNASNFEIVGGTLQLKSGVDLDLVGSRTITVKVSGNLSATVIPNETLNTPATVTWTSLNGTVTNRSSVASVINDDERTGTGGVNDYTKSDDAPIVVENVEPIKSIASTSETATTNTILDANGRITGDDVAIGEIVRYRLVTRLSEGQIDNLQIKDSLPTGLKFIDGTVKAGLVNTTTNNLSTTDSGLSGSIVANIANPDVFVPTFVLPDANVSASDSADNDTYTSGTDIFFKFGNISNTGTNSGNEYVVIEFDALVLDEAGNTAAKTLANNFDVSIGGTKVNTSTDATVKVVAPQLSITQALTVNGGTTGDAGDVVTITLTVKNTGTADAYEVKLEDILDATKFDLTNASSVTLPAGFTFDKNTPGKIVYSAGSIAKGATEIFTFTVPLKIAVNAGETLVSKAQITEATTIQGTPISGAERDIANPDILANDQQLTIHKPVLTTELVGTQLNHASNGNTEVVVGEIVTYRTTITVPEGTTAAAVLKDTLDEGLAFVGFTSITSSSGVSASNIANVSDLNTQATVGANGADFTLNLGNLVNTNHTNGTPETIVIEYQAVVLNTAANQSTVKESGLLLNNAATLNWTGNATLLSASAANVSVIEPQLQVIKDVTIEGLGNTGNVGDDVVYTITIGHTANSEADAYDVNLTDVLPVEFVHGIGAIEIVSDNTGSTLTNNDFQISGGNPATGGTAGGTLQLVNGKILNIPEGKQIVLKVTGKVSDTANLGQTFDSPAQITWTSLAGIQSNFSNYTTTDDNERTGTGNLNNYFAQDHAPATVTIASNLPQTNLPPQTQNASQTVVPGDTNPVSGLSGSDPDGTVALYQITTLPTGGTLYIGDPANGGIPVTPDTILTPTQLQNLVFDANAGFLGTTFTYAAIDNDGAKDTTPATVTLTAGNAPPETEDAIVPVSPNSSVSLASKLVAADPDGNVTTYTILTLPGDGQLFLNGNPVKAGDKLTPAQLSSLTFNAGSTFTHTRFTYTATDEDGDSDRTPATIFLKAPGTNLPPVAPDASIPISGGTTIDLPNFQATDPDGTIKTYTIDTLPTGGKLYLGNPANAGTPVSVGTELTGDDIKNLFFQADETFKGSSFAYTATDDAGDTDTGTITLTGGNNPPTTESVNANFKPGETRLLTGLSGSDSDGSISYYTITSLPSGGTLYLGNPKDGVQVKSGDVLTPDQIKLLVFQSGSNFTGTSFTYTATDNLGLTDPTPATVTIGVPTGVTPNPNPNPEPNPEPNSEPNPEPNSEPNPEPNPNPNPEPNPEPNPTDTDSTTAHKCQDCCPIAPKIEGLAIAPPDPIAGTDVEPPIEIDSSRFSRSQTSDDDDEVRGNDEKNDIWGDRGNDTLIGDNGDDRLAGDSRQIDDADASGEDVLYGSAGNDELNGNEKSDILSGGDGNDIAHGGKDGDLISGDLGNDTLGGDRGNDTILGSLGRFTGVGSQEEQDDLYGNQGRDLIKGGEGEDTLHAGQDDDLAYGGKDDDKIYGELGNDTLTGDLGDDTIRGGTENSSHPEATGQDFIHGGTGRDVLFGNESGDTLSGDDGDDRIHGGKDGDFISGDMGNDTLYGERGNDTLLGSLGRSASVGKTEERDLLSGNHGNDILKGGEGDDSIYAGKDNDLVYAGKDNDLVFGDQGSDTLVGDQGNDTISGGNGKPDDPEDANGHDVIFGGDGEDVIDGNLGNDSIITGSGNDHAMGGRGDDILWGEAGNDLLFGDLGNDTLCGGDGDDILVGSNGNPGNTGDGNDMLCGGAGNDRLFANEGDDTLNGGDHDDCLFAGKGNDLVKGDCGSDQLFGEEGNDTLIGGDGNDIFVLRQGSGTDTVEDFKLGEDRIGLVGLTFENLRISQGTTGAEIRANGELLAILLGVSATALTPASFTTQLQCEIATKTEDCGCPTVPTIDGLAIEPLVDADLDRQIQGKWDIGSDDIDILQGSIQNDRFDGRDHADRLFGYLGNDELYGNRGNDSISGGDGDDRAHGGQDGDLISGALGNDTVVGDRGNDTLLGSLGSSNGIGRSGERDLLSGNDGNDIIKGGEGDDHIYAGKNDDLVYAGKDNDLVFGDWGSDTLVGDNGDDTLVGGNGDPNVPESANSNDLIFGGAGNDSLNGNEGNDSLVGGVGDDESRGGKGNDVIWGESGNDLMFGELGSDTLCGGDGDDTLVGSNGNPGNTGDSSDKLCGGAGNDVVYANEGDDRLDGDSGDDTLLGGQQNDTLSGGAGNDFLAGEQGNDRLLGGEGSDLFQIIIGGVDTIADFQVGVDQIVLTGSLTWEQLTLTQVNNSTMIRLGTEQLAILEGVRVDRVSDLN
jgi:fimbrial isopeptide formation D2 family protein/uncharacterized repeat protein (TIGR01451 family)